MRKQNKRNIKKNRKRLVNKHKSTPNVKSTQKTYTIDNREAVAIVDWLKMVMMQNMIKVGNSSSTIKNHCEHFGQTLGGIYLKWGMEKLKEFAIMFLDDQRKKGQARGLELEIPNYHFMNKNMEMVDIKKVIFS